jgi:LCP family protein required for cell wall assembly
MAVVISMLVFGATAYAWGNFGDFFSGFTTADVLDAGAGGEQPADGAVDILLVGMDSRTDAQGKPLPAETLNYLRAGVADGELNTDTLIMLHIPNNGSKATAYSIPRDSYVDIPGGFGKHKINSAYGRAKGAAMKRLQQEGETDKSEIEVKSNQDGAKELVKTVQQLTGSTIDHYASVNLLGFYEITKAIGGVDVCLNDDVDEPLSGAEFKQGKQTISGKKALAFVRQRHDLPRGDLDRIARQQAFLAGMASKVLSAGTLTDSDKLNNLLAAVRKSVILDQQWDVAGFASQVQGLTGGQIKFQTVPVGSLSLQTDDGSAVQVIPEQVRAAIKGEDDDAKKPQPSDSEKQANNKITVGVRNASSVQNLATTVLGELTDKGFKEGSTGNTESAGQTVVQYPAGEQANGQRVAKALGGHSTPQEDSTVPSGSVRVVLGSDYKGVGSQPSGAGGQASAGPPPPPQKPITADGVTCVN